MLPLILALALLAPSEGLAFLKDGGNPAQDLLSRLTDKATAKAPSNNPEAILEELNLQSSTEPAPFSARIEQIPTLLSASVAPVLRVGSGVFSSDYEVELEPKDGARYTLLSIGNAQLSETGYYKPPKEPLELYELESDPSCKLVREACSMLSLTVTIFPTPKKGPHYRPEAAERFKNYGKEPIMYDPNTKATIASSSDIIEYLFQNYGPAGKVPWTLNTEKAWPKITAALGVQVARLGAGGTYRDCNFQTRGCTEPLVLYGYEGSPFVKIVRESLSELEIPHTFIFTPRGSRNRQRLYEKTGRFQVPYLEDPNTGVALFESEAIVEYLEKRYALTTPVNFL